MNRRRNDKDEKGFLPVLFFFFWSFSNFQSCEYWPADSKYDRSNCWSLTQSIRAEEEGERQAREYNPRERGVEYMPSKIRWE